MISFLDDVDRRWLEWRWFCSLRRAGGRRCRTAALRRFRNADPARFTSALDMNACLIGAGSVIDLKDDHSIDGICLLGDFKDMGAGFVHQNGNDAAANVIDAREAEGICEARAGRRRLGDGV